MRGDLGTSWMKPAPEGLSATISKPRASRHGDHLSPAADACEGNQQGAADRYADRLAIQRIAGRRIDQHRARSEARGVAEHAADIVVIGEAHEAHDERFRTEPIQQGARIGRRAPLAQRQHAAMDREAGDGVHDALGGGVDRDILREPRQQRRKLPDPRLRDQHGASAIEGRAGQPFQHHLALGHESALPSGEVALANEAEAGDPGIVRIDNERGRGVHRLEHKL